MCQECQEIEVGYSESSEAWDQTAEYGSEEKVLNSGIKEEVSGKVCTKCGEWKPLGEFGINKHMKGGFSSKCKACCRLYEKARRSTNFVSSRPKREEISGIKRCTSCGEIKSLSDFYLDKKSKDLRMARCKICVKRKAALREEPGFVPFLTRKIALDPNMKYCSKCSILKPLADFGVDKKYKDGHNCMCKECARNFFSLYGTLLSDGGKICARCKEWREISFFTRDKTSKDGFNSYCRTCMNEYNKEAREKKKELTFSLPLGGTKVCTVCKLDKAFSEFGVQYGGKYNLDAACRACRKEIQRKSRSKKNYTPSDIVSKTCRCCGEDKSVSKFYKNKGVKDGYMLYCKKCYEKMKALGIRNSPEIKLRNRLRKRLAYFIKRGDKISKEAAIDFLGCTMPEFRLYLEGLFYADSRSGREMSWENYGVSEGVRGWDLDHVIPLSRVDLEDSAQLKLVCNFSNIKPMWHWENQKKANRLLSEMVA